jgi:hypothetical protein
VAFTTIIVEFSLRYGHAEIIDGKPVAEQPADEARLATVVRRLGDLDAAADLLRTRIDVESRKASAIIVDHVAGTHRELVIALCETLIEAHKANRNYHQFADVLNQDSVSWTCLYPSQPNELLGQPTDKYGPVAIYLRQAVANGFIQPSAIPSELRL